MRTALHTKSVKQKVTREITSGHTRRAPVWRDWSQTLNKFIKLKAPAYILITVLFLKKYTAKGLHSPSFPKFKSISINSRVEQVELYDHRLLDSEEETAVHLVILWA